jgi:hypothetical protein
VALALVFDVEMAFVCNLGPLQDWKSLSSMGCTPAPGEWRVVAIKCHLPAFRVHTLVASLKAALFVQRDHS